jgi:hypothetical protein
MQLDHVAVPEALENGSIPLDVVLTAIGGARVGILRLLSVCRRGGHLHQL